MEEIVSRLHENRQIQLAKEILESNGYKVDLMESKDLNEIVSESTYKEPIRVNIKVDSSGAEFKKGYDVNANILAVIVRSLMKTDILTDNSDGTYQLALPGRTDWIETIQDDLRYHISSKINVEILD